jgi:hypothetical protein
VNGGIGSSSITAGTPAAAIAASSSSSFSGTSRPFAAEQVVAAQLDQQRVPRAESEAFFQDGSESLTLLPARPGADSSRMVASSSRLQMVSPSKPMPELIESARIQSVP